MPAKRGFSRLVSSLFPETIYRLGGFCCINRKLGEYLMQGPTKELWKQLCEQAAIEQNPERLMDLVNEINRLLDEKQERLNNLRADSKGTP